MEARTLTAAAVRAPRVASRRTRLLVSVVVGIATIATIEGLVRRAVDAERDEAPIVSQRARQVVIVPKRVEALPVAALEAPYVLLVGNSHTYALPGLERGLPLRPDPGSTLVDELHARVNATLPLKAPVTFARLAYPNFLPFEMLHRVAQLILADRAPPVVVLGLTWRNIARDRALRHSVRDLYRDESFGPSLEALLSAPDVRASDDVIDAIAAERREAQGNAERERMRSHADRWDSALVDALGSHFWLLGQSAAVRARIYRQIAYGVERLFVPTDEHAYSLDVVEPDLVFNRACIEALLRLLVAHGSKVLIYWAPERDDLPPMVDAQRGASERMRLGEVAQLLGVGVIDATGVVPSNYWGWERETPDRSHFTEPGHERLAQFIVDGGARLGTWSALVQHALQ